MSTTPTYTVQEIAEIISALSSMTEYLVHSDREQRERDAVRRAVAILKAIRVTP